MGVGNAAPAPDHDSLSPLSRELGDIGKTESVTDGGGSGGGSSLTIQNSGYPFEEYFQQQPRFLGNMEGDFENHRRLDPD